MNTFEYLAISALVLVVILFISLILGCKRKWLFPLFMNGITAIFIYFILIFFDIVEASRMHSFMVGLLGNIYLVSLIFM